MDVHSPYRFRWDDFHRLRRNPKVASDLSLPPERVRWLREYQGAEIRWPEAAMESQAVNWRAAYAAGVAEADRTLGDLFDRLAKADLLEASTVIVLSDHGEELFDHGDLGHGITLFDEVLRIPLLVRPPNGVGRGQRVRHLVSITDIKASLAAWHGFRDGAPGDGRAISLGGPAAPRTLYASAVSERPSWISASDDRFKAIFEGPERPVRLFDREADPLETTDVAAQHPALSTRFQSALSERLTRLLADHARRRRPGRTLDPDELERLRSLGYVR
jgi:arylsulfatase A-like enzyme